MSPRYDFESAVLGARFCDGGHLVNGEDAERLPASLPVPTDVPIATPEDAELWLLRGLQVISGGIALAALATLLF